MFQFPLYFALWIAMGMMALVIGFIGVHRADRRARLLGAETQPVLTQSVDAELVSAA